ncbi:MAG: 16S rRNA processing protein RimM [candidate division Zixibacteria bacterium]|nr:16S rRNA processing protein RimM [candidate division Zixibacteria bacterium]
MGRFGRPHGVSGEITITPATDDPDRFLELTELWTVIDGLRRRLRVTAARIMGTQPVVKIEGYDNREEAARLTNLSVEIEGALARPLPEGSYYQFDLVGCRVRGTDGTEYGVLEEVLFYPANDLYRIVSNRFGEVLFPAVDRFIVSVDVDNQEMIIDPPPGLFEPKQGG